MQQNQKHPPVQQQTSLICCVPCQVQRWRSHLYPRWKGWSQQAQCPLTQLGLVHLVLSYAPSYENSSSGLPLNDYRPIIWFTYPIHMLRDLAPGTRPATEVGKASWISWSMIKCHALLTDLLCDWLKESWNYVRVESEALLPVLQWLTQLTTTPERTQSIKFLLMWVKHRSHKFVYLFIAPYITMKFHRKFA